MHERPIEVEDPVAAMAVAAASAGGDPESLALLKMLIAAQTSAQLATFADELDRVELSGGPAVRARAARPGGFEAAWHPSLGGLFQLRRTGTAAFAASVAEEILAAAGEVTDEGCWPGLVAARYRTAEDAERGALPVQPEHPLYLAAGLTQVARAGEEWARWVKGAVRQVAPLPCRGREVASWSSLHYPGLVSMTLFDSPFDVAETLVHEASHQWWHMLDRVAPVVDESARDALYHSPVKRCPRPLTGLCLAFHAFGNIALFFAALRRRGGFDEESWTLHSGDLVEWLPAMRSTLDAAPGLTEVGRSLVSALGARLDEEFLSLRHDA